MMGSRVVDRENWLKYSTALVDTSITALEAIRARDMDKISAAGDALYEVCETCHMQYMPKPPE
jgi:cytochrome c556